jgi:hypothetical protein
MTDWQTVAVARANVALEEYKSLRAEIVAHTQSQTTIVSVALTATAGGWLSWLPGGFIFGVPSVPRADHQLEGGPELGPAPRRGRRTRCGVALRRRRDHRLDRSYDLGRDQHPPDPPRVNRPALLSGRAAERRGHTASEWAIQDSNLGPLPYQRSALTD